MNNDLCHDASPNERRFYGLANNISSLCRAIENTSTIDATKLNVQEKKTPFQMHISPNFPALLVPAIGIMIITHHIPWRKVRKRGPTLFPHD